MKPVLFIFSGAPGAGKTAMAKKIAARYKAAYFRLDTVEQENRRKDKQRLTSEDWSQRWKPIGANG